MPELLAQRPASSPARHAEPRLHRIFRHIGATELFMVVFSVFLMAVAIIGSSVVSAWLDVTARMVAMLSLILAVNYAMRDKLTGWKRAFKIFYISPLVPIYFKTAELISYPLHGRDFDDMLIGLDRMLTGVDPTSWLSAHLSLPPVAIDYLQVCYSLFYFLPVALGIELYRRAMRREREGQFAPPELTQLHELLFLVVYGFLLSYAAYFLLPSVGPRFTLHDFHLIDRELPGAFLAHPLRDMLNRGENVMPGMTVDVARRVVTRDAFPSGHTDITLLTMLLAFRYKARMRWVLLVLGSSLIFATVYLRYHYVVDVIGGALLMVITLAAYPWFAARMQGLRDRILSWA
jgi:membrane-associated phospholipid phosphatase